MIPSQVALPGHGMLTNTLGRVEPEAVAAVFVRWHHVHSPDDWVPIGMGVLARFIGSDPVCRGWGSNPIWVRSFRRGIKRALDSGFIDGWIEGDPTSEAHVTASFLAKVADSPWNQSELVDDRTCRICGCTNVRACEEGCHWVEADLCSECVEVSHAAP